MSPLCPALMWRQPGGCQASMGGPRGSPVCRASAQPKSGGVFQSSFPPGSLATHLQCNPLENLLPLRHMEPDHFPPLSTTSPMTKANFIPSLEPHSSLWMVFLVCPCPLLPASPKFSVFKQHSFDHFSWFCGVKLGSAGWISTGASPVAASDEGRDGVSKVASSTFGP